MQTGGPNKTIKHGINPYDESKPLSTEPESLPIQSDSER